ncbi:cytochrome c-type biogenesis protein CcsB [Sphaerotilus hippei]|uniref:Cytochrome c-type biogenesis protein CcsB n=1 Tax=Sphaerotilus hippei TaxID=744406 RepID=A0A318GZ36_9BURK|nr:c-type cytochrome biogenesis protein CcsB [Sphaerotilus hippei]PXW92776.1 cytochrome c-type biogenesis protein CcsB [Sphaerotilus hippei]
MSSTTTTTTLELGRPSLLGRRGVLDWLFAALILGGAAFAWQRYGASMDGYERGILICAVPALVSLGWFWSPLRLLSVGVGAASLLAIALYQRHTDSFGADLAAAETVFWLKYALSSQSAILWMGVLVFMSTITYWIGLFAGRDGSSAAQRIGSGLAWAAVFMALVGTFVRWFESHQIGADIGHIPVSNLYEVFVLFTWMTTLFYLYYEQLYGTRSLGAFVMLIVSAAVGFLLWYTVSRGAQEIQPLVPALQSWWMKIHVPANFVGYGTFALSAMVALAYLLKSAAPRSLWTGLVAVPGALLAVLGLFLVAGNLTPEVAGAVGKSMRMLGVCVAIFAFTILTRRTLNARTPAPELLDDLMYKAIAVGFAFFTIATILGAFWAAEAWGGYWSWDPKETWALIVWLNYAAWLHMRLVKGLRGVTASWWALIGLLVTTFAFLGVNMFLSGLHSYGEL